MEDLAEVTLQHALDALAAADEHESHGVTQGDQCLVQEHLLLVQVGGPGLGVGQQSLVTPNAVGSRDERDLHDDLAPGCSRGGRWDSERLFERTGGGKHLVVVGVREVAGEAEGDDRVGERTRAGRVVLRPKLMVGIHGQRDGAQDVRLPAVVPPHESVGALGQLQMEGPAGVVHEDRPVVPDLDEREPHQLYSSENPVVSSNFSVRAFSVTVRTVWSGNRSGLVAVISRRTSRSTPT